MTNFRANFGDDSDSDEDNNAAPYNDEESEVYEPKPIGSNDGDDDDEEDELDKFMMGIEVKTVACMCYHRASVARSSGQVHFTPPRSWVNRFSADLCHLCENSQSGYSGFLPQGILTKLVGWDSTNQQFIQSTDDKINIKVLARSRGVPYLRGSLVKIIMINLCLDLPQTDSFTVAVLHDQT